jgi:hypothetical protein
MHSYPKNRKEEFEKFCADFGRVYGASEKGGVMMQIRWATTRQDKVDGTSWAETYFRSKLAAFEVGFIDKSYFPTTILQEF